MGVGQAQHRLPKVAGYHEPGARHLGDAWPGWGGGGGRANPGRPLRRPATRSGASAMPRPPPQRSFRRPRRTASPDVHAAAGARRAYEQPAAIGPVPGRLLPQEPLHRPSPEQPGNALFRRRRQEASAGLAARPTHSSLRVNSASTDVPTSRPSGWMLASAPALPTFRPRSFATLGMPPGERGLSPGNAPGRRAARVGSLQRVVCTWDTDALEPEDQKGRRGLYTAGRPRASGLDRGVVGRPGRDSLSVWSPRRSYPYVYPRSSLVGVGGPRRSGHFASRGVPPARDRPNSRKVMSMRRETRLRHRRVPRAGDSGPCPPPTPAPALIAGRGGVRPAPIPSLIRRYRPRTLGPGADPSLAPIGRARAFAAACAWCGLGGAPG